MGKPYSMDLREQQQKGMKFPVAVQALWGAVQIDAADIESAELASIGGGSVRLNMKGEDFVIITPACAGRLHDMGLLPWLR